VQQPFRFLENITQRLSHALTPALACAVFSSQVRFKQCAHCSTRPLLQSTELPAGAAGCVAWKTEARSHKPYCIWQVLWTGPGDIAWARHTPLTVEERSTVQLFKDNTPAVVYITNLRAG
jgi:hypothetical protein